MTGRRTFLKESAFAATALALPRPFPFGSGNHSLFSPRKNQSLTILHTNDIHCDPAFDRTAKQISDIKRKETNVLLVDAGDIFSGDLGEKSNHHYVTKLMQSAGYDAVLPGNHDFRAGLDYFEQHWQNIRIPLVVSNYSFENTNIKYLHQSYKILHKGDIRIGIIGAGINLNDLAPREVVNSIVYRDPVAPLSFIATRLKQEKKCHLVVCLSHLGFKNRSTIDDLELAAQSENIDIIIGGHSHTIMKTPSIVLNKQHREVIVNHAGCRGNALGNIQMSFNDKTEKTGVQFNNIQFNS